MKHQKLTYYIFLLSVFISLQLNAQDVKPEILNIPENWKFERMDFPLDFAPEIKYEGFEELIFSPGMFDIEAPDYFSYIFVMSINNKKEISKEQLEKVLLDYYLGLSLAVAESKEIVVDTTEITASVTEVENDLPNNWNFNAEVDFIDTFTNARKIKLAMELDVNYDDVSQRLFILAIVSPTTKKDPVWETLSKHRSEIIKRNPQLQ